ncbi:MAG: aminotransferase class I/II-fold pyridoxal phosphate-dependent enzyme [Brevibacterium sp.]|nr:aminotransferase class I/II-fold pyridoxal phosphate-dependent enzyme [Brevibacterium sp.]MDN5875894.1 aminotransferase class I/II-fold pyridoxal phosphate-dependent enzyme [Brevibacterium sp.]MDN5910551.1 aminotransferase class I/II-fold pyridoxal phosphate-dependent enzyme [Brevibacterium sp.]MDN6134363.1 aminotransferase class I/II-fold pyridoxal phosphate-dependent enzyme [Brevibacterium sp.]MDN6159050.1 aminotransferase class I/II-fold pyridoxal phosphate-dependent enzyme [Brevibacteriu
MPDVMRADLWHSMADAAGLIKADGTIGETIYGQMTALAERTGAVNLGQGAPGTAPPAELIDAAADAMREGYNQYAPGQGFPALLEAVARQRRRDFDQQVSAEDVLYTCGATEGLTAAVLALLPRGGTVLTFEPFYDGYPAAVAAAGGSLVTVPILPTDEGGFEPDWVRFDDAVGADTAPSIIIVNTPHNPTGFMFSAEELARIGHAAVAADAWILTDEVYEQLILDDTAHVAPAVAVDDSARVVTVSSAGKSWNATGWKVGWVIADSEVLRAIQAVKQFLTFTASGPLQIGVARSLAGSSDFVAVNRDSLRRRADVLVSACRAVPGAIASTPAAGYFTVVDFSALTDLDAFELNDLLARRYSIVGIPVPALCRAGSPAHEAYRSSVRYSFCKSAADVDRGARLFHDLAAELARDPHALRGEN